MTFISKKFNRGVLYGNPKTLVVDFITHARTLQKVMVQKGFTYLEAKTILSDLVLQSIAPTENTFDLFAETVNRMASANKK